MIDIGAGLVARGATESDAETVFQVQAAHNVPVVGDPDGTPEDVVNELIEPGFDLATDGWLVEDDRGVAVGWGQQSRCCWSDLCRV